MLDILKKKKVSGLEKELKGSGKTRWLDIGSGGRFDDGFECMDVFAGSILPKEHQKRYHRANALHMPDAQYDKMGQFDLVRMQHVFEHFSMEDGLQVLKNCARLCKPGGIVLVTVPDLRVHIQKYLDGEYKNWDYFKPWAHTRIPEGAPDSFYFSIFSHSVQHEAHLWSYDAEGLKYQFERSGLFDNIRELKMGDDLASQPFTHNRPEEDACVIAVRK